MSGAAHPDDAYSGRVVVLAPTARDAEVTLQLLGSAGIEGVAASDAAEAVRLIRENAGALVLTDLTLAEAASAGLLSAVEKQPPWSNLPVLALCRDGLQSPALRDALKALRNLTVLDRPVSAQAMISAVQTALRGRRWQYQIRDQIESLLAADTELRDADRRKDEFLATLAHELRNPLAPIRTGLHLLERLPADEHKRRELTDMMNRQMNHLLRLVDELLEISRISTGKLTLRRERLDLRSVVASAIEANEPHLRRAGHRLAVAMPDEALFVNGDLTRLAQALGNLIHNAAKYTPDGGDITIDLRHHRGEATLAVSDTGIGIPPDMINRVFEMFVQVDRSVDRKQGGLGIGLALVRSLVGLHGGRVEAASAGAQRGSTFTIHLPLAAEVAVGPSADDTLPGQRPPPLPLRVLVVDDNEDAAETLGMLLTLAGHDVRIEHSGRAALATAALFSPQAIFCDIGMPDMSGYEFASRLRHNPRFATTLLVAVTGWCSEEDKRRTRGAGFDEHLTKPAGPERVSALLESVR